MICNKKNNLFIIFVISCFCIMYTTLIPTFLATNLTKYKIKTSHLPENISKSLLSIEDRRFFYHVGFDPIAIFRSTLVNVKHKKYIQGGSTITQQLAKNLFLTSEKTMKRKIKELIYSIKLEFSNSKVQILELYMDNIYFGQGCYGISEASMYYFDKTPTQLTLGEAAFLAAIPQAPSKYSQKENFPLTKKRQLLILQSMYDNHLISSFQLDIEKLVPLQFSNEIEILSGEFFSRRTYV